MGETRVDLLHLLEDLRDAYTGSLEETILTEIVANSLDSEARTIRFAAEPALGTLTVVDDGSGMLRRQLARFHDIASTSKTRGEGIGFAGVGIKLGLLLCREVVTETRRSKHHVATRWHLASRNKAPWKWINPPPGVLLEQGTAVTLHLTNPLSPLLDKGFIEGTLLRHFQTLFDPRFAPLLAPHYPNRVEFSVNGRTLPDAPVTAAEVAPLEVRIGRQRKPSASGYLVRDSLALAEDRRGVAISTLGKVIKRGWDWLGLTPSLPDRIGGVIEVPALAECLTLSKADFVRSGPRGLAYLGYRKAIQEAIGRQLAAWGDAPDAEATRRRVARPVERDLERVLVDLADDFPMLGALVERRHGGQHRLPIGRPAAGEGRELVAAAFSTATESREVAVGMESAAAPAEPSATAATAVEEPAAAPAGAATFPGETTARRPARYALSIQFESRPGEPELARLVDTTVWVNDAHAAYRRAAASRSEGYHLALAVALALAPLAVEPAREHAFLLTFLERWGAALEPNGRRRRYGAS